MSTESHAIALHPSSPMEQAEGSVEMVGEVEFRRDATSNLMKAVSGTEWMYRRGALERGRRVCVCARAYVLCVVCIRMCACACVCVHVCVLCVLCVHVCVHVHVCVCTCAHVCVSLCVCGASGKLHGKHVVGRVSVYLW